MTFENPALRIKNLQDIICCPVCKNSLTFDGNSLWCAPCGLAYTITEGIPDLVVHDLEYCDQIRVECETDFFSSQFGQRNGYQVYALDEYPRILDAMQLGHNNNNDRKKVLSIGCASGVFERELMKRNYQVVGVDLVTSLLQRCEFLTVRADAVSLPFIMNAFDHVICIGVLHHVPEALHAKALREILRVLKPGQTAHFFEPNATTRSAITHPASQFLKARTLIEKPISLPAFQRLATALFSKVNVSYIKEVKLVNLHKMYTFLYQVVKMIFDCIPGTNNKEFFVLIAHKQRSMTGG